MNELRTIIIIAVAFLILSINVDSISISGTPDQYEPDNTIGNSHGILVNGTIQTHSFYPTEDTDHVKFTGKNNNRYTIETGNLTNGSDTVLYLYDTDGTTVLAINDDIVMYYQVNSRIVFDPDSNGEYFVKISDWNSSNDKGTYTIKISEGPIIEYPDCFFDDTWNSCTDLEYLDNLSLIRVNADCNEEEAIEQIQLTITNIPDSEEIIDVSNATYYEDGYYFFNTEEIIFDDSGEYLINVTAITTNAKSSSITDTWTIPWGELNISMIQPPAEVFKNELFEANISITCNGGECQNIQVFLDPIEENDDKTYNDYRLKHFAGNLYNNTIKEKNDQIKDEIFLEDQNRKQKISKTRLTDAGSLNLNLKTGSHESKNSLIIKLKDEPKAKNKIVDTILEIDHESNIKAIINDNIIQVQTDKSILEEILKRPEIENIYPDEKYHISLDTSVPLIGGDVINSLGSNGTGETICVIDTGVSYTHSSLGGCIGEGCRILGGYDFVNDDDDPIDDHGHGTHVIGTIISQDETYTGVAPGAKIVALKACDSEGSCLNSHTISAIDWCINNRDVYNISVISMSLGSDQVYDTLCTDNVFNDIISNAYDMNITVVAASGNAGSTEGISAPACTEKAISVGSMNDYTSISSFTNRFDNLDILAPGSSITSTSYTGGFTTKSGTSMATPHASGAIALIMHLNRIRNIPNLIQSIYAALMTSEHTIYDATIDKNIPALDLSGLNESKGLISTIPGATPFYTINNNPFDGTNISCLSSMGSGEICNVSWQVNSTGEIGNTWKFFSYASSDYGKVKVSQQYNVTIAYVRPDIVFTSLEGTNKSSPIIGNWTNITIHASSQDNMNISNISSVWLFLDSIRYSLNESLNVPEVTISRIYDIVPGKHNLMIYTNNSQGVTTSKNYSFYSSFEYNLTDRIIRWNDTYPNITSISISHANGSIIIDPDRELITDSKYRINFDFDQFNISLLNLSGFDTYWNSTVEIGFNKSIIDDIDNISTEINEFVYINTSSFISENANYSGQVKLGMASRFYYKIFYIPGDCADDFEEIDECVENITDRSNTPCFSDANETTVVYLPHFSSIAAIKDQGGPNITIYQPANNSIILNSTGTYLNISIDEAGNCTYSINSTYLDFSNRTNISFFDQLAENNPWLNGEYNITINCTDNAGNPTESITFFTLNDTTCPNVTVIRPTGTYTTTTSTIFEVPIEIYTNEYASINYSINGGSMHVLTNISNRTLHIEKTITLTSGSYNINITAIDINNNSFSIQRTFSVSASFPEEEGESSSSSSGGGGSSSMGIPLIPVPNSSSENITDIVIDEDKENNYEIISDINEPSNSKMELDKEDNNTDIITGQVVYDEPNQENPSKIDANKSRNTILALGIGTVIFVITSGLIGFMQQNNKTHYSEEEIKTLILECEKIAKVHSIEEIESKLADKGWPKSIIKRVKDTIKRNK